VSEWLNRFRAWFEGLGRREKLLVSAAGGLTLLSLVWRSDADRCTRELSAARVERGAAARGGA